MEASGEGRSLDTFRPSPNRLPEGQGFIDAMVFLYIVGAIAIIQGIVSLIDGIRSARHIRTFRPTANRRDQAVTVFRGELA